MSLFFFAFHFGYIWQMNSMIALDLQIGGSSNGISRQRAQRSTKVFNFYLWQELRMRKKFRNICAKKICQNQLKNKITWGNLCIYATNMAMVTNHDAPLHFKVIALRACIRVMLIVVE